VRSIVIGTAGHIDHGKSALVKALTGTDPDRLKEERERGITIDLGFAHVEAGGVALSFVDVPGHERFVRNMLAGAGGIDAVLLVVAADESVKPQTREHFDITRLIGIDRGVIALTKADLADADLRELTALDVRELVAGSALEHAPIIPVSAKTGEGLETLVQALTGLAVQPRLARAGVVRLPVDRVFTVKGFGTVVTGTLVSGRVADGDALVALPAAGELRVRGAHVHGHAIREVSAPSRVALNISGPGTDQVMRGVTLATPDAFATTRRIDVRLELLASAPALKHGARLRVHHGTEDVLGRIALAAVCADGVAWTPARPGELGVVVPPGGGAFARIRLDRPAVLTRGDRLVLRVPSPAATIAGATVLDPEAPAGGVRRPTSLARFEQLADVTSAARTWLVEAGGRGLTAADFVRRGGLDPDAARALATSLLAGSAAVEGERRLFDRGLAVRIQQHIREALTAHHRSQPAEAGMFREALRERVAAQALPALFEAALLDLARAGVTTGAERVALATHRPSRSGEVERAREAVVNAIQQAGLMPPEAAALAAAAGLTVPALDIVLQGLVRDRRLVRLDAVHFHPETLERLKEDVRARKTAGGAPATIDVAEFKTRYGLSRKYAIPLLEWLDRERVTRRVGEKRIVL
jgi:selenocysteine-specific elongation factor